MTIAFGNEKLKKQLSNMDALGKAFPTKAKTIVLRLNEIIDCENLGVFMKLPGPSCRPVTNNFKGPWRIDAGSGCSIIFLLDHDPVPVSPESGKVDVGSITRIRLTGILD